MIRRQSSTNLVAVVFSTVFMAGFLGVACWELYHTLDSEKWPSVNGHCESSEILTMQVRQGQRYTLRLNYSYRIGDRDYSNETIYHKDSENRFRTRQEAADELAELTADSKVIVYYHPTRPSVSYLRARGYGGVIGAATFALALAALTLYLMLGSRRGSSRPRKSFPRRA